MNPLLKLSKISDFLFDLLKQDKCSYLFFFLVGLVLRGIPELLITQYPVGYETTAHYAPIVTRFQEMSIVEVSVETLRTGLLFYMLLWFATVISGAHAFLLLKVTGAVLYGCLAVVFFVFLRRGLSFKWKIAFVSSLLLIFQVATLRMSWDRFRNVLGLIFVFAALSVLRSGYRLKWSLVASLAVLTVLSREYIALILFIAVLGFAFLEKKERFVSFVVLIPALTIFAAIIYPTRLWWNYISEGQYALGSYLWIVQDVLSIFVVCYLPLLPFVLKGFRRDRLFDPILGFLLLSSFSVVLSPWFAVPGYQRWLMLLVYPFSVYAGLGFERFHFFEKGSFKKLVAVLLIFIVIGMGYSTGAFSYVGMLPNSYVAVNLVQSSIPWNQVDDVKGVLMWLDENAVFNSSVLAEERFYGWTMIYLKRANDDVKVISYGANSLPQQALERALADGYRWIYLIWYTDLIMEDFRMIHSLNSVSIFQYER